MTPWSIGWLTHIVLGVRKINLTWDKFSISVCTGQLSINKAIFRPLALNPAFSSLTQFSINTLSIQLLFCDQCLHGKVWMYLKHLRSFAFLITNNGSFSLAALAPVKPVILVLLCFPPDHFSDSSGKYLLGKHRKNKPNSPALSFVKFCISFVAENAHIGWNMNTLSRHSFEGDTIYKSRNEGLVYFPPVWI